MVGATRGDVLKSSQPHTRAVRTIVPGLRGWQVKHGSKSLIDGGRRLFLASGSPRRRELLADAGVDFEVVRAGVDDGVLCRGRASPWEWAEALAYLKAAAGLSMVLARGESRAVVVLGADTVCVLDGEVIGQPRDAADAGRIIRAFRDREHEVVTGVALIDSETGEREMWHDTATVRLGALSDEAVDSYASSGAWRGKAGAYNLAERLAAGWPICFEGDATTVMGLPMGQLRGRLGLAEESSDPVIVCRNRPCCNSENAA